MNFELKYVNHKACIIACKRWHYSKSIPAGKKVSFGLFENDIFKGVIIYSMGANRYIANAFELKRFEVCELTRIALDNHQTTVSKIISISMKLLKNLCPELKIIVSYADENQNHFGGVYKASNFLYIGKFANERGILINGKLTHRRSINAKYGSSSIEFLKSNVDKNAKVVKGLYKHKYIYCLNEQLKRIWVKQSLKYPCVASISSDVSGVQLEEGGAVPTATL
jgi:hypothetical protein